MSPASSPTKCCSPNQARCSPCCMTLACGWRTAQSVTRCWHKRWCRKPSSPPGSTPRRVPTLLTARWPTAGVKPCQHARGLPAPGGPRRRGSPRTGRPLAHASGQAATAADRDSRSGQLSRGRSNPAAGRRQRCGPRLLPAAHRAGSGERRERRRLRPRRQSRTWSARTGTTRSSEGSVAAAPVHREVGGKVAVNKNSWGWDSAVRRTSCASRPRSSCHRPAAFSSRPGSVCSWSMTYSATLPSRVPRLGNKRYSDMTGKLIWSARPRIASRLTPSRSMIAAAAATINRRSSFRPGSRTRRCASPCPATLLPPGRNRTEWTYHHPVRAVRRFSRRSRRCAR